MAFLHKDNAEQVSSQARQRRNDGHTILVFDRQMSTLKASEGMQPDVADVIELIEHEGWQLDHVTMANTRQMMIFRKV